MGEKTVEEIITQDIRGFLAWLRTGYRPVEKDDDKDDRANAH